MDYALLLISCGALLWALFTLMATLFDYIDKNIKD